MKNLLLLLLIIRFLNGSQVEYTNEEKKYLEEKKSITMCVDPDWEPFEIINNQGVHEGLAGDLIRLIAKRGNLSIKLIPTKTWDESLEFSKQRKCDILSFLNDTEKRRKWLTFTKPLFSDPNVLIGRIDRNYIEDISKENLSIALPRGTAMMERFQKEYPNLTFIPTTTEKEAFSYVEDRKVDITLRSLIVAAYTIKKEGLFNLKVIGEPKGYENHLCVGVRNDEPILKDILNKSIETLSKKDRDDIVNNHVTIKIEKVNYFTVAFWILGVLVLVVIGVLLWNYLLNRKVKQELAKNLEQEKILAEQSRKVEISDMIANISHQWKNGLTQISALNLEMSMMNQFDDTLDRETLQKRLKESEHSIDFMNTTMNLFLNFYKGNDTYEEFSIKNSIEQVLKLIEIKIKTLHVSIEIKEEFALTILGNQNEWLHVWLNLINNSITSFEKQTQKESNLLISIVIQKDFIVYKDSAGGFASEVLKEIKDKKYSGLGLKMTQNILEKHHFSLEIQTEQKESTFRIFQNK